MFKRKIRQYYNNKQSKGKFTISLIDKRVKFYLISVKTDNPNICTHIECYGWLSVTQQMRKLFAKEK